MNVAPPPLPLGSSQRTGRFLFFGALGLAVTLLVLWPTKSPTVSFCAFQAVTGFPCGLCGGTRAVRATLRGDLASALYFNPAAVVIAAAVGGISLGLLLEAVIGRKLFPTLNRRVRIYMLVVLFVSLVPWTIWHAYTSFVTPKPELLVPDHPVLRMLGRD